MKISFLNKLRGRSMREIYLYIEEKVVKNGRKRLYNKSIRLVHPLKQDIQITVIGKCDLSNIDIFLADSYCNHVFNLLGSGPKKICRKHPIDSNQIQSISSFDITEINSIIQNINHGYELIEWQEDFKNNYLFNVNQRSNTIQNSESNGFDVKVPWELARCQHLPFLARLYRGSGEQRYRNEIICEILDFIAYNPIDYGVNWKCTMDVAIRVCNWIMALNLLQENLDKEIEELISKSIYQHCVFIRYHLEDQRNYKGNHYLSDIVGLLYSSTFFQPEGNIRKIQDYAIKQMFASIDEQFYDDGGNFESSLPYHRLSLELIIFGLWRLLILSECNNLCHQYVERIKEYSKEIAKLGRALGMMLDAIKPDGNIYQLGDNDSGHLFRLYHYGEILSYEQFFERYGQETNGNSWDENELNCNEIKDTINTILGVKQGSTFLDELIGSVFQKSQLSQQLLEAYRQTQKSMNKRRQKHDLVKLPYEHKKIVEFAKRINIEDIRMFYYLDFGLAGLKNDFFYLGVSITDVGQRGRGGHSHNDKLSYDLFAEGIDYQCDPGTYVYTESREWRNRFRSSVAHNSPYFGEEHNLIGDNCFELKQRTECELMELTDRVIQVSCKYGDIYVIRRFELSETQIIVTDYSNKEFVSRPEFEYFSNGYGKIIRHKENKSND